MTDEQHDTEWVVVAVSSGESPIAGLPEDIWDLRWQSTGESVYASDPPRGTFSLTVQTVDTPDGPFVFAAREVSNGVTMFAIPRRH